ncbi:MAG: Septum site-determining protein MinC [Pseudomonadota bacterium]|jgi:septum site-determining protein MinC
MSDTSVPSSFEIKSANLPLIALILKSASLNSLKVDWQTQFGDQPHFFNEDWLLIDLSHLPNQEHGGMYVDFKSLIRWLRQKNVVPVAVKGGTSDQIKTAQAAGLLHAPDVVLTKTSKSVSLGAEVKSVADDTLSSNTQGQKAIGLASAVFPSSETLPALVVDKPLRSGQRVYARGRDLVVLAMVNAGAEVVADGHIHVYAPLRGKAIAGATGDGSARVFALALEPELISIAGIYRTSEHPFPPDVAGKPAMVWLQSDASGDKLMMEPIKP